MHRIKRYSLKSDMGEFIRFSRMIRAMKWDLDQSQLVGEKRSMCAAVIRTFPAPYTGKLWMGARWG